MRRTILLALFAFLFTAETLGIDLVLVRGLSAKNIVLYLFLFGVMLDSILDTKPTKIELPDLHLPFIALIVYTLITWVFFTHANILELSYQPIGEDFSEIKSLMQIKSFLIDRYAFLVAFFYGVVTMDDSRWVMKRIIWLIIAGNLLTLIDAFNVPDLGIIHQRDDSRVSGPLGESNQYAAFALLFLPTMAILAIISRGAERLGYAFGALATFTVILLTTSRGAIVGLTLGLLTGLFFLRHHLGTGRMVKVIVGLTVAIGVTLAVASIDFSDLMIERFVNKSASSDLATVTSGRSNNWTLLIETLLREPVTLVFGYGWGMAKKLSDVATHNTYLEVFFELGIIGFMIFVGLLWAVVRVTRRAIDRATGDLQAELGAFLVGFLSLCFAIFFVNLFNAWLYVWAFSGVMMRTALEAARAGTDGRLEPGAAPALEPRPVSEPVRPATKWPVRPRRNAARAGIRHDR
ncbi:MAG: O-antigen ligase family protein [Gammaproteobacteria bacterium]|nr:O-antigen ligase family protein [Gammaproteobacteria bacterium]